MYRKSLFRINDSGSAFLGYFPTEDPVEAPLAGSVPLFTEDTLYEIMEELYPGRSILRASVDDEDAGIIDLCCMVTIICHRSGTAFRLIPIHISPSPEVDIVFDLSEYFDWEEVSN